MSNRRSRRSPSPQALLAWALFIGPIACVAAALVVVVASGSPWGEDVIVAPLLYLSFSGVGLLVVRGAPRNAVGWLLLVTGVAVAVNALTSALVEWDTSRAEVFPGAPLNAMANQVVQWVALGVLIPRVLLLFPTGRVPTARWRVVGWAQVVVLATLPVELLVPGPITDYPKDYDNPLGVGALGFLEGGVDAVNSATGALFVFGALGSVLALVVRARRSVGIERLQVKWVAWGAGIVGVLFVANALLSSLFGLETIGPLLAPALCLFPISVGVAILRYRLYEIDRIISRTLVYGALTVILGAGYVVLVLAGQALFSSFAGGSNLAIAVSTLVVAAFFLPLRARVQRFVDRRFYRRRYDAQQTLRAFGVRLREEVDLETLAADLTGTVAETMQPAHESLWLRRRPA